MKKLLLSAVMLLTSAAFAQKTVTEIAKPTTPEDDAKPNSDKVPEVYAVSGQLKRVVVLRFKYQTDLLAGMEKMVKEQKIKNAVFLSGIGSLRGRSGAGFVRSSSVIRIDLRPLQTCGAGRLARCSSWPVRLRNLPHPTVSVTPLRESCYNVGCQLPMSPTSSVYERRWATQRTPLRFSTP